MPRLKPLAPEALDAEQRALFDAITTGKRSRGRMPDEFFLADGGLRGPFNAWLRAPNVGQAAQRLGEALHFESALPAKLRELAILLVAQCWRADYEWWAHSRIAAKAGLEERTIAALERGGLPDTAEADERTVYRFARELIDDGRVTETTYREAGALLGDRGVVELVTVLGYYTLVSMTLNAFEVALPEGEKPPSFGRP